eukprot:8048856-Pyramimonas_sp.AAC.1
MQYDSSLAVATLFQNQGSPYSVLYDRVRIAYYMPYPYVWGVECTLAVIGTGVPAVPVVKDAFIGGSGVPVVQDGAVGPGGADAGVGQLAAPAVEVAVVLEDGLQLVLRHPGAHALHHLRKRVIKPLLSHSTAGEFNYPLTNNGRRKSARDESRPLRTYEATLPIENSILPPNSWCRTSVLATVFPMQHWTILL